jgi:Na+-driven multidrug efflux pump
MKKTALIGSAIWAAPLLAFAQTAQNLRGLIGLAGDLLNMLIPVLIALALVIFFWGLVMYIWGSSKGHGQGKNIMIAGLLALFIMVSVWGIIRLFQNTLGVQGGAPIPPPYVPTVR